MDEGEEWSAVTTLTPGLSLPGRGRNAVVTSWSRATGQRVNEHSCGATVVARGMQRPTGEADRELQQNRMPWPMLSLPGGEDGTTTDAGLLSTPEPDPAYWPQQQWDTAARGDGSGVKPLPEMSLSP